MRSNDNNEISGMLTSIVNFSDDAIISRTLEGTISTWNRSAERIFIYSCGEAIGKNISIIIPDEKIHEEKRIFESILLGENIHHHVTQRRKKDGTHIDIALTASPIRDSNNNITAVLEIAKDITEQKKLQEEIVQLNKELEAFSYSVSHDLKAPLRSIRSYAEILAEDYASTLDDYGRQTIASIVRNGERMTRLIDDLLEFSYRSAQDIVKTRVNMNDLVNGIFKEVLPQHSERKIDVRVHSLTPVLADHSLLKVVWENFISNALKYTRKKETATIEIGCSNTASNMITYFIKDNGAGFDQKYDFKLFNVFQRLHNQRDFEGTGVGLATVQRIIVKHGGRVWAEGKIDEGAAFYFTIPAS